MAYRVEIARRAESDLEELYLWVVDRAPQQGARWFNGLERAVLSLDQHPKRCPVAPESFDPDHPVRVLTYGRKPHAYRVFFTVDDDGKMVRVLHVRRGARQRPMAEELRETKATVEHRDEEAGSPLVYDGNPSAVVAQRGDIVYTADVIDLQRLQTFFPAVTLLAV